MIIEFEFDEEEEAYAITVNGTCIEYGCIDGVQHTVSCLPISFSPDRQSFILEIQETVEPKANVYTSLEDNVIYVRDPRSNALIVSFYDNYIGFCPSGFYRVSLK